MNVVLNEFQRLRALYLEWSALKEFLVSLGLRVIESENPFVIVRYVKGKTPMKSKDIDVSFFRSVVIDKRNNTLVSLAPFKAETGLPPINTPLNVEDFVDGCMIQAFMTHDSGLYLATRTQVGADNTFYSSKSFATLFEEGLKATPMRSMDDLNSLMLGCLDTNKAEAVFASFVIQHPEHRIVAKHRAPDLNCVHFGYSLADGKVILEEDSAAWAPPLRRLQIPKYPISDENVNSFTTVDDIHALLRRTSVQNGFLWQGLVFKDGTGKRWKLRTKSYLSLRELRGGEALPIDRFLRLRKDGAVVAYLKHYGEEREAFWEFESTLRLRTKDLLTAYEAANKLHSMTFASIPDAYKPGVYTLHSYYLNQLRPEKKGTIKLSNAIDIVNGMKPFEQKRLIEAEPW